MIAQWRLTIDATPGPAGGNRFYWNFPCPINKINSLNASVFCSDVALLKISKGKILGIKKNSQRIKTLNGNIIDGREKMVLPRVFVSNILGSGRSLGGPNFEEGCEQIRAFTEGENFQQQQGGEVYRHPVRDQQSGRHVPLHLITVIFLVMAKFIPLWAVALARKR
jgi:hypothetical protein